MSTAEQNASVPLEPGTPLQPNPLPPLTPSNLESTPAVAVPPTVVPSDSLISPTPDSPSDQIVTTSTAQGADDGSLSDNSTYTLPAPVSETTTSRTRSRTSAAIPSPSPYVTPTRGAVPVDTWTTLIRTSTTSTLFPDTTQRQSSGISKSDIAQQPDSPAEKEDGLNAGSVEQAPAQGPVYSSQQAEFISSDALLEVPAGALSPTGDTRPSEQTFAPHASDAASVDRSTASTANDEVYHKINEESGMTGTAGAGLAFGVLAATAMLLLAFHFHRRHSKAAKRRQALKEQSNALNHRRNGSGHSWPDTDADWLGNSGEKPTNAVDYASPSRSPPPSYLPEATPATDRPRNTWSMWVERLSPGRPPSTSSSALTDNAGRNEPRISVVSPSLASSRVTLLAKSVQNSRASSALSGIHLQPPHVQSRRHPRPLSEKSRESLATVATSSTEPSPAWVEIANRFPIPNQQEIRPNGLQDARESSKDNAFSDPFRTYHTMRAGKGDLVLDYQRYSQNTAVSNNEERNPFEFESETGAFDVDFSRIGLTPAHSGHSTVNPTTPITPVNRRKSASSLSLYSEDDHTRSLNPFAIEGSTQRQYSSQQAVSSHVRGSMNEALDIASTDHRPWSPLEISSAETSRKPSFVSNESGPDLAAWEDELADPASHTPTTCSRIVDTYAGRAI